EGLGASTFGASSFQLFNTSADGVQVTSVSIDLSTAILPDMVFDPTGAGGDQTASVFTANSGAAATGLVAPADPAVDPFSAPRNGGFDVLTIDFTDFDPGESLLFTTDVDPNSIQGVPGAGAAGSVSGFELIGSTVTVTFSDGSSEETAFASLFDQGSLGGGQGTVTTADAVAAPTLALATGGVDQVATLQGEQIEIDGTEVTVQLTGTPGAEFTLLLVDARLFIASGDDPFDVSPEELAFYANEAMAKALVTGTFDASGTAEVPVTLLETAGAAGTPDGGLNILTAIVTADGETSATATPLVLRQTPPPPSGFVADFEAGADGFVYVDDAFGGTAEPAYADGTAADGVLKVDLGGVDNATVDGMSGGWSTTFDSAAGQAGTLTVNAALQLTNNVDDGEVVELRVLLDGEDLGPLASLEGSAPFQVPDYEIDFQDYVLDLGPLDAGSHTLTIGGLMNRKTKVNESAEITIDSVALALEQSGADSFDFM
ncbi:MAG: hypothetical protein AAFZ09_03060, partial [Pseudomonadota bacterium]